MWGTIYNYLPNVRGYIPDVSGYIPNVLAFRSAAQAIEFSTNQLKEVEIPKRGKLVRFTYEHLMELEKRFEGRDPGFIKHFIVGLETVAKYPEDPALLDEQLRMRFGNTHSSRYATAVLDKNGLPLSIVYSAVGNEFANTLHDVTSGNFGIVDGASPTHVSNYSAINLTFKDKEFGIVDPERTKLGAGIGGIHIEASTKMASDAIKSIENHATLSPLNGFEKWVQTAKGDELAALEILMEKAGISLEEFRAARLPAYNQKELGKPVKDEDRAAIIEKLSSKAVEDATRLSIAFFVMKTKLNKKGKIILEDLAAQLHVGNGAIIDNILLGDPLDPRMRYLYVLDGKRVLPDFVRNDDDITIIPVSNTFGIHVVGDQKSRISLIEPVQRAETASWSHVLRKMTRTAHL